MVKALSDPVDLHAALEHEAVEQGQHEDEHGCLGKEGGAAMGGDRDEIEERGGFFWAELPPPGWN